MVGSYLLKYYTSVFLIGENAGQVSPTGKLKYTGLKTDVKNRVNLVENESKPYRIIPNNSLRSPPYSSFIILFYNYNYTLPTRKIMKTYEDIKNITRMFKIPEVYGFKKRLCINC